MPEPGNVDQRVPSTLLQGREAVRAALPPLLGRAQRDVLLFAVRPDPYYFDTEPFAAELAAFASRHRQNRARFLVDDPARLAREHTRLADALHRLTDVVQLREIAEHDRGRADVFLLIDRRAYLVLEDGAAMEARAGETPREAVALAEGFEAMWERAIPAFLRPLGL